MNVGLVPIQNLSKSGLKPDYDDQDALENIESAKGTKSYKSYAYI